MPPSMPTRIVINSEGTLRCIGSIRERAHGDLLIDLRSNQLLRATGMLIGATSLDQTHGVGIREFRYSVHMSRDSRLGINTIKLTNVLENGEERTAVQMTSAIKQSNSFAGIYVRRCSNLLDDSYNLQRCDEPQIKLGEVNPLFTLIFAVFVGPRDREFVLPPLSDGRFQQVKFREFSIVIMWTFMGAPSHESAMFGHVVTPPGNNPSRGLNEIDCLMLFHVYRENLKAEYIRVFEKIEEAKIAMPMIRKASFFREARRETPEYVAWHTGLQLGRAD